MKKKEYITIKMAVHPIQAWLMMAIRRGEIDLSKHTLREMCQKIGEKESPQIIKHHLEQLVTWGALDKRKGQYYYDSDTDPTK